MAGRKRESALSNGSGFALIHMAVTLTGLLLFTGLAVDAGRGYVVKVNLTKAVDGAALGAARHLNSGDPQGEATRIFKANFPLGFMGTSGADPTAAPGFFSLVTDQVNAVNIVTVTATAQLPTTFMRLGTVDDMTVTSSGEARRKMVDLCLSLDVSSSIGSKWAAVRDASRTFVEAFDQNNDRLALVFYGHGANVVDAMPSSRGFNKTQVVSHIPNSLPGGSTAMVQGLYRCWDEVRAVPTGSQSSLRVIVLFTDGASNSVPGIYPGSATQSKGLRTYDFPKRMPDPDNQTHDNPNIEGLFHTQTGVRNPSYTAAGVPWASPTTIVAVPYLPLTSFHSEHRSSGIPTSFPLQSASLTVNGAAQNAVRGLRNWNAGAGRYPAHVININNAARNLVEIIADAARSDGDGDYPVRIYTIGMGELVRYMLGSMPEQPEQILMRVANDKDSADFNSAQLEGKYYFALTGADVGPAFQALQSEIIRLTK